MKMDIVSSVTPLTFTAAKDQLHSETKMTFSAPSSEVFCQSDTQRPFYPFPPNRSTCFWHDFSFSDVPVCLVSQPLWCVSAKPLVCCVSCAAFVWARNWFTCQWFQKAAFITRKLTATCKNRGKVAMPDVIAPPQCYQISSLSNS